MSNETIGDTKAYKDAVKAINRAQKKINEQMGVLTKLRKDVSCLCPVCQKDIRVGDALRIEKMHFIRGVGYEDDYWYSEESEGRVSKIVFVCHHCNTLLESKDENLIFVRNDFGAVARKYQGMNFLDYHYPEKNGEAKVFKSLDKMIEWHKK